MEEEKTSHLGPTCRFTASLVRSSTNQNGGNEDRRPVSQVFSPSLVTILIGPPFSKANGTVESYWVVLGFTGFGQVWASTAAFSGA